MLSSSRPKGDHVSVFGNRNRGGIRRHGDEVMRRWRQCRANARLEK